jgi:hypothetical protein
MTRLFYYKGEPEWWKSNEKINGTERSRVHSPVYPGKAFLMPEI